MVFFTFCKECAFDNKREKKISNLLNGTYWERSFSLPGRWRHQTFKFYLQGYNFIGEQKRIRKIPFFTKVNFSQIWTNWVLSCCVSPQRECNDWHRKTLRTNFLMDIFCHPLPSQHTFSCHIIYGNYMDFPLSKSEEFFLTWTERPQTTSQPKNPVSITSQHK